MPATIASIALACLCVTAGSTAIAQNAESPTIPTLADVDPDLLRLVIEDQWDRGMDMFGGREVRSPETIDWVTVAARNEKRQAAVRAMLAEGKLRTPREQHFAALIFQHSDRAENLALAHLLASTSAAGGHRQARWLSAASWDRYLRALSQPQVFGTQFTQDGSTGWTMDPYDRTAIPDSLRAEWCVVPLGEQDQILEDLRAGRPMRPTSLAACSEPRR